MCLVNWRRTTKPLASGVLPLGQRWGPICESLPPRLPPLSGLASCLSHGSAPRVTKSAWCLKRRAATNRIAWRLDVGARVPQTDLNWHESKVWDILAFIELIPLLPFLSFARDPLHPDGTEHGRTPRAGNVSAFSAFRNWVHVHVITVTVC